MSITRTVYSVHGNSQRLDGGAMFGNAPKALWSRWVTVDEQNRIPLACRCLLIKEESSAWAKPRYVLCETGIGAFFEPKMRVRFGVQEAEHLLIENLAKLGVTPQEIDVVVLSHLHFDHAGGLLTAWKEDQAYQLIFPQAQIIVGEQALERAQQPHPRDRASFIPELLDLLMKSNRLEVVPKAGKSHILGEDYSFFESDGHTPGQLLIEVKGRSENLLFCGDLIPGVPWVHLPITMGYDRFPELLIEEKEQLLQKIITREQSTRLFFTHDSEIACAYVTQDEQGRFKAEQTLSELNGLII